MNGGGGVKVVNSRLRLHKNPWKTQVFSRPAGCEAHPVLHHEKVGYGRRVDRRARRIAVCEEGQVGAASAYVEANWVVGSYSKTMRMNE